MDQADQLRPLPGLRFWNSRELVSSGSEDSRMSFWVYMLQCSDGSYYVGSARGSLERRLAEHEAGTYPGYTARRRPVTLVWSQGFSEVEDAIAAERQIEGWRREKKQALIAGDFELLPILSKRSKHPSRRACVSHQGGRDAGGRVSNDEVKNGRGG